MRLLLSLLVACAMLGAVNLEAAEPRVGHMVFFELAKKTPENQQKLIAACDKYLSDQDGVVYYSAGGRAEDFDRSVNQTDFDVALHLVFKNKAAHDAYQVSPKHKQFIKENNQLWGKVQVFDSYLPAE